MFLLFLPSILAALVFTRAQYAMGSLPIGYDVSTSYLSTLLKDSISLQDALNSYNLLYWILGSIHSLGVDELLLLKITGVIIPSLFIASFTYLLYQFFPKQKSLVCIAVIVFIFQLATLRLSWDLYRNSLGLIFAMLGIALIMHGVRIKKIYSFIPFAILSFVAAYGSHQMVTLALIVLGGISLVWKLSTKLTQKYQRILLFFIIPFLFFILSPQINTGLYTLRLAEPSSAIASRELFLFLFSSSLPLVVIGALTMKNKILLSSTILLLLVSLSPILDSAMPFYLWDRWMYFLVIPFGIYTARGILFVLDNLQKSTPKLTFTILALILLAATLPGVSNVVSAKNSPPPFSLNYGDIFSKTPPQFLWNSIGFEKIDDLKQAAAILAKEHDGLSPIYISTQYLGFAYYFLPEKIHSFIVITAQSGESSYKAPVKRYYLFGVNYGKFAEGKFLEGSPSMQPVQLYDASRP